MCRRCRGGPQTARLLMRRRERHGWNAAAGCQRPHCRLSTAAAAAASAAAACEGSGVIAPHRRREGECWHTRQSAGAQQRVSSLGRSQRSSRAMLPRACRCTCMAHTVVVFHDHRTHQRPTCHSLRTASHRVYKGPVCQYQIASISHRLAGVPNKSKRSTQTLSPACPRWSTSVIANDELSGSLAHLRPVPSSLPASASRPASPSHHPSTLGVCSFLFGSPHRTRHNGSVGNNT